MAKDLRLETRSDVGTACTASSTTVISRAWTPKDPWGALVTVLLSAVTRGTAITFELQDRESSDTPWRAVGSEGVATVAAAKTLSADVAAVGTINITTDIILTSVATGTARNTETFTVQVLAAAANPTDTVLIDYTGTSAAIICTVTPNDGTNNSATPVNLTSAELRESINDGTVSGKTVTITDGSGFRILQTATGGDATDLADAGEGDGVAATFASGVDSGFANATNLITLSSHGFVSGDPVIYGDAGGTAPTGLTDGTLYYVIKSSATVFQLAADPEDVWAGTAVTFSDDGVGAAHEFYHARHEIVMSKEDSTDLAQLPLWDNVRVLCVTGSGDSCTVSNIFVAEQQGRGVR